MSYREPLSDNMFFHNQDKVDEFVSSYPVASGNSRGNKECSDFQAGSEMVSKGKYYALDETAVCGLGCKHGIPMDFLNLKGGERLAYGVYLLSCLTTRTAKSGVTVHFMYDICCLLESHLKKQNNNELLSCIKLACPQFHVYGHGATCQLMYSPRRLDGWGLIDGEVLERL
ncbi:uncharacterized protein LOC114538982 isoform X2 [Dendronephthya gigantea]|nr:uncharacterized protein LOC114538982 isoform X2 [Dendronephthya gigantea]